MQTISLFGATGSIGTNALEIIRQYPDRFKLDVMTANNNAAALADLAREFMPRCVVIVNDAAFFPLKNALKDLPIEVKAGALGLLEAAHVPVDIALCAISGIQGLPPTFAVIPHCKKLAIANKESIVSAGPLILETAKKYGTKVLPVDSEHNAIFQVLDESHHPYLESITLTASGGPFRTLKKEEFAHITKAQALTHPNFAMGAKNTLDSATLANKGLELIEASYLFNVPEPQVNVIIHPQQIIHSFVSYPDGSTLAQLGLPDMRTPIAYALSWPERIETRVASLNLAHLKRLDFEEPDVDRFPCLKLARQALATSPGHVITFNVANDQAFHAFMRDEIRFVDIPNHIEAALTQAHPQTFTRLSDILEYSGALK